jgi:uncharacterized membrane protein YecN with MAPEG domain
MLITTSLYASLLAILVIYLALNVVSFRRAKKVGLGDNGDSSGQKAIRAHANAVEYIPLLLILMAIYEINYGSNMMLHILGGVAVFARIIHALGLSKSAGVSFGRFYGTALTWIVILILAGMNLVKYSAQLV